MALPSVEGVSDLTDVFCRKIPQYPVFHVAKMAGINKQKLAAPVALLLVQVKAVGLVAA